MVSNFFGPSHILNNNICGNFLFSILFILVLYRSSFLTILWKLVLKTGLYKYQKSTKKVQFRPVFGSFRGSVRKVCDGRSNDIKLFAVTLAFAKNCKMEIADNLEGGVMASGSEMMEY